MGKNGIGKTNPDSISDKTINILTIPFSSNVIKQITWYKRIILTVKILDKENAIININNLGKVIDKSKLKGDGNKTAIKITGRNLSNAPDNFSPNILLNHIKYKSCGLQSS